LSATRRPSDTDLPQALLAPRRSRIERREDTALRRLAAKVLDDEERREELADGRRQGGMSRGVLLDQRLLAAPPPLDELLRQALDLFPRTVPVRGLIHFHGYSAMPGMRARSSRRRTMARR
jgi:hypothetical protein